MTDDWLRAEPLWFGVDLVPLHGIQPEPKRRTRRKKEEDDDSSEDRRSKRRSVSGERRQRALERKERVKAESDDADD